MKVEHPKSTASNASSLGVKGYSALVVDDNPTFQEVLAAALKNIAEIENIDFADSGNDALVKAEANHYDLIFLDVMMPGIDGYETCTQLRYDPMYKKTPVIMVSGNDSPFDEVKGIVSGCTTYVTKPINPESFIQLVNRVLNWLDYQKIS